MNEDVGELEIHAPPRGRGRQDIDASPLPGVVQGDSLRAMDARLTALARAGAAAAVAGEAAVRKEIDSALAAGVAAAALHEALLQSYLFVGYPRAINALIALADARGTDRPDPDTLRDASPADLAVWRERGERLCRQIYGESTVRLQANIAALHPDLADWMVVEGYGKVLSRPQLGPRERELAVLGILAADVQLRQLESHVRGALRVGATPDEARDAVRAGLEVACVHRPSIDRDGILALTERVIEKELASE